MEEEAQSVRGRGWVKFDGEEETDSGKGNSESPGSLEVRANLQCSVHARGYDVSISHCRRTNHPGSLTGSERVVHKWTFLEKKFPV